MWKHSHAYVAKQLSSFYNVKGIKKHALIFGSIFPDIKPSCFYRRHTYSNWNFFYFKLEHDLNNTNKKNISYYFKLGILLHFSCDFFTRPHNNDKFYDFVKGHNKWERELDSCLASNFKVLEYNSEKSLNFWLDCYNMEDSIVAVDCHYINRICNDIGYKHLRC